MKQASKLTRFKRSLERVVNRARRNQHQGDRRTEDLNVELERVRLRVAHTLEEINREAANSESPDEDAKVLAKLERAMEILTDEMMQLSGAYHRTTDIAKIRGFLNEQRDIVQESMYGNGAAGEKVHAKTLDGRIVELHDLMAAERRRINRASRRERWKFWASITIALVSLSISAYALWLR